MPCGARLCCCKSRKATTHQKTSVRSYELATWQNFLGKPCGAMQARWFEDKLLDYPERALTVEAVFDERLAGSLPGTRDWRRWWFDES